jgi:hypothetical protein
VVGRGGLLAVSRVGNIGDVARVSISNVVLDSLDATVGKLEMKIVYTRTSKDIQLASNWHSVI